MAGHKADAVDYVKRQGWPQDGIDFVSGITARLSTMRINSPASLDFMWGASFATGDPRYAGRIMDAVSAIAESDAYPVAHLLAASRFNTEAGRKRLRGFSEIYGKDKLVPLIVAGSALWALGSNADQHPFVKEALVSRSNADANPEMRYILSYVRFHSENDPITIHQDDQIGLMLSMNPDDQFVKRAVESNDLKRGMNDFRNEFTMGEPVYLALMVFQKTSDPTAAMFEITSPNGEVLQRRAAQFSAPAEKSLRAFAVEVERPHLAAIGAYTVTGTFRTGDGPPLTITNQFFLKRE